MSSATTTDRRRTNGQGTTALRVTSAGRGRWQARAPWIALAALLIAGGALIAVVLYSQVTGMVPALALATDVERGDQLTRDDLRVTQISADGQVPRITPDEVDAVVGRTVTSALAAGALLSPQLLERGDLVAPGTDVVGLALEPGSYPVQDLRAGDTVAVFASGEDSTEALFITDAEVNGVSAVDEATTVQFVSINVPTSRVAAVTAAAARAEVRLALKGSSR